ncbi:MAG: glycosyltransferase family 2 protein [Enterocloster citroniae]|nr:glycosyltransferase family 2 protein [Enterocloster citroniae]
MRLQVLVSTMNQADYSLSRRMKLNSDAIIINQCNKIAVAHDEYNGYQIHWYSFDERGVGLSRNNALMRADSDIVLFSDDDVVYVDGYKDLILNEFKKSPEADVIIFNVSSNDQNRTEYINNRSHRLHLFNCLRYGAVRIAVRLEKIRKENIYFHLMFGGGALYGSGEDSIFLSDCIRHGLKLYASNQLIGCMNYRESSWFHGYSNKYFRDKGALFACISKKWFFPLCLQYCFRHHKKFNDVPIQHALYLMLQGAVNFRNKNQLANQTTKKEHPI